MATGTNRNGIVFHRGAGLDGAPIVGIATGLVNPSTNIKTGPMLQTYILRHSVHPTTAITTGQDSSICGDCPLRGNKCYVEVGRSVNAIFRCYDRGGYAAPADIATPAEGHVVRMGAYGDPAAIPVKVWRELVRKASGFTGYTHQWRTCDQALQEFCMASVETEAERLQANAKGWRTFRVAQGVLPGEIVCPASAEAGHKTTCDKCQLCKGTTGNGKDIVIAPHGSGSGLFKAAA